MPAYTQRPCPICGASEPTREVSSHREGEGLDLAELGQFWSGLFKEKVFFTYARCAACGMMYCPVYFTSDQLAELYADMAPNMDLVPSACLRTTQEGYWREVAGDLPSGGDYLEVGPDIGYFVEQAAESGRFGSFWLFEPNLSVHDHLQRAVGAHRSVLSGGMEDFSAVPDGSVTLAVMVHVLDHMLDPLPTLRAIRQKLRPDGRILVVTHNESSLLRHLLGTRWPPFCLQHPEIYNPKTMTTILEKAGFSHVAVKRSINHFPLDLLVRQGGHAVGLNLDKLPLPPLSVGLKLGNMITVAQSML